MTKITMWTDFTVNMLMQDAKELQQGWWMQMLSKELSFCFSSLVLPEAFVKDETKMTQWVDFLEIRASQVWSVKYKAMVLLSKRLWQEKQ